MKKLISAASALAMAASMVGSAVPFVTGAADASKALELRPYLNKDGSAISSTVSDGVNVITISEDDAKAGAVSVPIGVYFVEGTNDTEGILAQWTVTSSDGDPSKVKFSKYAPGAKFFSKDVDIALKGDKVTTNKVIGFAGTVNVDEDDGSVSWKNPNSNSQFNVADNYMTTGCAYAWGSIAWATSGDGKGYKWTGEKSDSNPVMVFTVDFPAGATGTYSIDFVNKAIDENGNYATMVETDKKYTVNDKNLNLTNLKIKIGGGTDTPAPVTTEAPAPVTTKAPDTTAAPAPTTTTAGGGQTTAGDYPANPSQAGKQEDFVLTGSEVSINPGESANIDFIVQSGGHKAVIAQAELDLSNAGTKNGLSYAVNTSSKIKALDCDCEHTYDILDDDGLVISANLINEESKQASELKDGASLCRIKVTAAADATPGKYIVGFKSYHVVENSLKPVKEFDATVNYAKVEVKGADTPAPVTTEAPAPVTTEAPAPTTTTTAAPAPVTTEAPAPTTTQAAPVGNKLDGDVNCDGKVNIADVVLLNKWLNDAKSYDMSAQGKINADVCDSKNGEGLDINDSKAIIKSIVHLITLPTTADKVQ